MTAPSARSLFDIRYLVLLALFAWFILNVIETGRYVVAGYSPIPVMDYWHLAHNSAETGHRLPAFLPNQVYRLDTALTHGRMYLPIALSAACYLGVWFVLVWAAYSQKILASPAREAALLMAGIIIVWKGCSSAIATPLDLQWTLTQLLGALAFAALGVAALAGRPFYLLISILAAAAAAVSSSMGVLIWCMLFAAALFLRVSWKKTVPLLGGSLLFTAAHFVAHPASGALRSNLGYPVRLLQFAFTYLSMPFGSFHTPAFAIKLGALNLVLMSACLVTAWTSGVLRSRLGVVVFGLYFFTLLSALAVAANHMDPNDPTFSQAKAWRYVTLPTVGWALLAVALIWMAAETQTRSFPIVAAVLIAFCCSWGFRHAKFWVESTRLQAANAQVAAIMLQNEVVDHSLLLPIVPDTWRTEIDADLQTLETNRQSIYSRGRDKWLGQNMANLPKPGARIAGKITRLYPVPGGLLILGWADSAALSQDHAVLFVTAQNKIVGFGRRPAAGLPATMNTWDTPGSFGFIGFVSHSQPLDKLSVYVRGFHGKVIQPMDGVIDVPAFTPADSHGEPLTGISWQPSPIWNPVSPTVLAANGMPPAGPIYASSIGLAGKTGSLVLTSFPSPSDHCLVILLLHGASTYGQSAEIRDADTQQTLARLPMLDGLSVWERWRIPLPESTRNVTITADDEGNAKNQWLALAVPELCR